MVLEYLSVLFGEFMCTFPSFALQHRFPERLYTVKQIKQTLITCSFILRYTYLNVVQRQYVSCLILLADCMKKIAKCALERVILLYGY